MEVRLPFTILPFKVCSISNPDSVTAAWDHALFTYLEQGIISNEYGIPFEYFSVEKDGRRPNTIRGYILRPNHPKTLELQKRAGVPDSRMARPMITRIEDHMLISDDDVRNITESYGGTEGWKLDALTRADGWEEHLQEIVLPKEGEEKTVTKDSIVIVNNGAHVCFVSLALCFNIDGDVPVVS